MYLTARGASDGAGWPPGVRSHAWVLSSGVPICQIALALAPDVTKDEVAANMFYAKGARLC
jgi:hypothetical protein